MKIEIESKDKGMELLTKALPYPDQIEKIDLDKEGAIYFTWRHQRYKFELKFCEVMRSDGCILEGGNDSLLMSRLLKLEFIKNIIV